MRTRGRSRPRALAPRCDRGRPRPRSRSRARSQGSAPQPTTATWSIPTKEAGARRPRPSLGGNARYGRTCILHSLGHSRGRSAAAWCPRPRPGYAGGLNHPSAELLLGLNCPLLIGLLLIVQMPNASDVRGVAVILSPLDRGGLSAGCVKNMVTSGLDNVVRDRSTFGTALRASFDENAAHWFPHLFGPSAYSYQTLPQGSNSELAVDAWPWRSPVRTQAPSWRLRCLRAVRCVGTCNTCRRLRVQFQIDRLAPPSAARPTSRREPCRNRSDVHQPGTPWCTPEWQPPNPAAASCWPATLRIGPPLVRSDAPPPREQIGAGPSGRASVHRCLPASPSIH
jgi:hypothetical protein